MGGPYGPPRGCGYCCTQRMVDRAPPACPRAGPVPMACACAVGPSPDELLAPSARERACRREQGIDR
ncbi:hypothetical protein NDU88_004136 [Pleurodeles waltl]|uniref:Uncharacterized protein n=1 Tax=Pleurodeles waltl TaxID=8319 RepID=A0AAV7NK64_PLEWA|nr:hypothetical protein NDU88_004136 [Pleurodeles waltl]